LLKQPSRVCCCC